MHTHTHTHTLPHSLTVYACCLPFMVMALWLPLQMVKDCTANFCSEFMCS